MSAGETPGTISVSGGGFGSDWRVASRASGPFWPHAATSRHVSARVVDRPRLLVATTLDLPAAHVMHRILSIVSSPPRIFDELSDAEYDRRTRAVFAAIEATIDRFLEDDVIDIDASRTGGLLELAFPGGSKIVVNTQPPLHELWLAAQGGGFHFRAAAGQWIDGRDDREFFATLSDCASAQAGRPLRFAP